jgi:hypothetical protein
VLGGQADGGAGRQEGDGQQSTGKAGERFKVACGCQPPPGMAPGSELARRFEELAKQMRQFAAGVLRLWAAGVPVTMSSDAGVGRTNRTTCCRGVREH